MKKFRKKSLSAFTIVMASFAILTCEREKPTESPTSIQLSSTLLNFSAFINSIVPDSQFLVISNGGNGVLEWAIVDTITWANVSPMLGVGNNDTVICSINTTSMNKGTYISAFSIISGNASNSPRTVLVAYEVMQHPIVGTYNGLYRIIGGYQTPAADTQWSTIQMLFSDESYFFNSDNNPDAFCNPRGSFAVSGNSIYFTETQRNCAGSIANENDNPRGGFSLQLVGDSVTMLQQTLDTLKEILLERQ